MGNKITEKLRQGGFTLMEMIAALVVMGSVMVGVYSLSVESLNNTKASVLALHLRTVGDAANQYIKANTSTITTHLTANPTTPYLIQISDLTTGGQLPPGYALRNGEGQAACVLVLKQGDNLNALVLTEGGNVIDDLTLGQIAATIGGAGGAVYTSAATTVKGAMGGWSFSIGNFANTNHRNKKCDGTGGAVSVGTGHPMMALWLTEGNADAATLYRDAIPGNPSLNTMNTPIIMGASIMKTEGSACGGASDPVGSIAKAPDGSVLSCILGNTWQRPGSMFWREPVANFALLPTTDPDGAVRVTRDTGRAFMWNSATSNWAALAVDQNGDLKVSRNLTVEGNSNVIGNSQVGGGLSAVGGRVVAFSNGSGGYVRLSDPANTFHTDVQYNLGGLEIKNNAGTQISYTDYGGNFTSRANINAGGRITANEFVQINGTATLGDTCPSNGLLARSSTGVLLSCQSNVWKMAQGGGEPTYVSWPAFYTGADPRGYAVSCPSGEYVRGYMLNVPPAKAAFLRGFRSDIISYRQGCRPLSSVSAICYNVYTPGQWDNWSWGNNYDFGGFLVCSR